VLARDWVKDVLRGCARESDILELTALVSDIVRALARAHITEEEAQDYMGKLCESIAYLTAKCDKPVTKEKCIEELFEKVKEDAMGNVFERVAGIRELLRRKRAPGETERRGLPSIF